MKFIKFAIIAGIFALAACTDATCAKYSALGNAATINSGNINEEKPRAQWHICRHDEGKPCEPAQDI